MLISFKKYLLNIGLFVVLFTAYIPANGQEKVNNNFDLKSIQDSINKYSNKDEELTRSYQQKIISHITSELPSAVNDSISISYFNTLCDLYEAINTDSMLHYAKKEISLFFKNEDLYSNERITEELQKYGFRLSKGGDFASAKEIFFRSLIKAEEIKNTDLIVLSYIGLGSVNRNEYDIKPALKYLSKAEELLKDKNDNEHLIEIYLTKGKCYEQLDILDSALIYCNLAYNLFYSKFKNDNEHLGVIQGEFAVIHSKMKNWKLADENFRQAIKFNIENNMQRYLSRTYFEFAEHFDRLSIRDSAIYYSTKALGISKRYNFITQTLDASTLLTSLYTQSNKIDSAFKYQKIMLETNENLFSREKINLSQLHEFNEQLRQIEIEDSKKIQEKERRHNIEYTFIALIIIFLIAFILLVSGTYLLTSKVISFLSLLALLIFFEFLNLILHNALQSLTGHSPALMLIALVIIGALLIPIHKKLESWAEHLVLKNKEARLAHAKKTIKEIEGTNLKKNNKKTNPAP